MKGSHKTSATLTPPPLSRTLSAGQGDALSGDEEVRGFAGGARGAAFLLRRLEKVRTEWRWVCTAYNLKQLITAVAALRAKVGAMALSLEG